MAAYVPLWCKSNYSFLEGASHPEELVEEAHRIGLSGIALTDRDGLYGVVRAHLRAKELGLKLLLGSEVTLEGGHTVVLLAQNKRGYNNLCRLLSTGRLRSPKGSSSVSVQEVIDYGAGLLALLLPPGQHVAPGRAAAGARGPEGGPAHRQTTAARIAELHTIAHRLKESIGDRLYVAVARHHVPEDVEREELQRSLARDVGASLVAASEVLYHRRERRRLQDVLTCIRHGVTLDEAGTRLRQNAEYALDSAEQMTELFAEDQSLLRRSAEIAERCSFSLDELSYRYPSQSLPDGYSTAGWLRELTFRGARKRYPEGIPAEVGKQLNRELDLIEELEYSGYFLTMWEIVEFCRQNGILCQGRGSAANSAVCYCLGITAIDPVRMDLLFERFISRERAEPPDIDLDIEHNRREEVIQHMYEAYGRTHAAMVANIIRYRLRSAVRDVGKALGIPQTRLDRIAKLASSRDTTLAETLESLAAGESPQGQRQERAEPEAQGPGNGEAGEHGVEAGRRNDAGGGRGNETAQLSTSDQLLLELTEEILDFPRHLSIHPGGFLLGSEPVSSLVPVENATMPGRTVIQWDKYDVEEMGLFKVDLLGLGALTHLQYAFALLERHYGIEASMAGIPAHDPRVFQMLSRADTVGVFQLESRAQMAMLPRLKPKEFYDLVIEVSIVRPGPITGGMVHPYLRRRDGTEEVSYPHPNLEPVLKKTLGVPLFQEQVMKVAMVAADYTPGEADTLRKDMAAWRRTGRIEQHRSALIERMERKGIAKQFAERVFDQIRGFGEYGFPESHAASFALIAYCTAWMRSRYPEVFACALLNAWPMGFYAPATIVADARRHGIRILPVDAQKSRWECTLEAVDGAGGKGGANNAARGASRRRLAIRMGLRFVKGFGKQHWKRISTLARDEMESVKEFARASGLDHGALAALARSGALECFGLDRRQSLWTVLGRQGRPSRSSEAAAGSRTGDGAVYAFVDETPAAAGEGGTAGEAAVGNGEPDGEAAAAGEEELGLEDETESASFPELDAYQTVVWDYQHAMHSAGSHPLEPHREALTQAGYPDAAGVHAFKHGRRISYIGLVICRQRPDTAKGTVFFTLEDETGFVNLIVRQEVFQKHRAVLLTSAFLGIHGTVQTDGGTVQIIVDSCFRPHLSGAEYRKQSRDFH